MKRCSQFILCFYILVALSTCQNKPNLYIFFTSAYETGEPNDIDMDTYVYKSNDKSLNKVSHLKYYSQYPLTTYSKQENCVYYSHCTTDDLSDSDAIYKYDLKTKKNEKYIDYVDAINDIRILDNHQMLIIGQLKDVKDHNIVLTIYDTQNKTINDLSWDKDQYVASSYYDPISQEIVLGHYSLEESY